MSKVLRAHPETARSAWWRRWIGPLLSLLVFLLVLWLIHREFEQHSWRDVLGHIETLSAGQVLASVAFTAGSYLALTFFEVLGLRHVGHEVPYPRAALTSFVAYAVGHNIGLTALSGGAIRLRMYGQQGLATADIAVVTAFCALTTALATLTLIGVSTLTQPAEAGVVLHLGANLARVLGTAALVAVAAYLAWSALRREPLSFRGWTLRLPGPGTTVLQIGVGVTDLCCAAAALYVLLPSSASISYPAFLAVFALAIVAAMITNVPGGLGVIEAVVILALPEVPTDELLGRLLAFRLVYYLLPLVLASVGLAVYEARLHRGALRQAATTARSWVTAAAPQALGSIVFLAGGVLLLSGVTPAIDARMRVLGDVLPLPVLELSHLLGSVAGLGLVVLSRALFRRVHEAWWLAILLALAGAAFSLSKGFDYEEAGVLLLVALLLWLGRDAFPRKGRVLEGRLSPPWLLAIVMLLLGVTWIGLLAHRHVEYSNELWWTFALHANAPRMLRATLAVTVLSLAFVTLMLLSPAAPEADQTLGSAGDRVRAVVTRSPSASAALALLGDKRFLFHPDGDVFVMYQVSGRSWISMGDPVGPEEKWPELVWMFRELCDRYGGWSVFYEVPATSLAVYVDAGLALLKLGEEARVALPQFALEGPARAELRQAHRRGDREGLQFELLEPPQSRRVLDELRLISEGWLQAKAAAEKGFSVGFFNEAYLAAQPMAIVRREGTAVAFANLWTTQGKRELSIDLMRFSSTAPKGVMDYLFIELMLWGRAQGYQWFNLGMAPLAGVEPRPLGPSWNRLAGLLYAYGEHFYNFEGLRRYKQKFDPTWEPRYLAAPGGLALPRILVDVASLIAGGLKEIVRR